jgi:hypothetical protein
VIWPLLVMRAFFCKACLRFPYLIRKLLTSASAVATHFAFVAPGGTCPDYVGSPAQAQNADPALRGRRYISLSHNPSAGPRYRFRSAITSFAHFKYSGRSLN